MTYEEAKALSDKIASDKAKREKLMVTLDNAELAPEYEWCEREAQKCDFLNNAEKCAYRNALFDAVIWGKQH